MNFYDLLKLARGEILKRSKDALEWYKDKVLNAPNKQKINPTDLLKPVGSPEVGKLYFFKYDAKLKNAKLSYFKGDFLLAQEHLDILQGLHLLVLHQYHKCLHKLAHC